MKINKTECLQPIWTCRFLPSISAWLPEMSTWAFCQIRKIAGCACARKCRFPRHRGLAIPTCITARGDEQLYNNSRRCDLQWWSNTDISPKNIERHTADTIVSWPNPKQWVTVHTSDLMMIIRQSVYIYIYIFSQSSQQKWVNWKHTALQIV